MINLTAGMPFNQILLGSCQATMTLEKEYGLIRPCETEWIPGGSALVCRNHEGAEAYPLFSKNKVNQSMLYFPKCSNLLLFWL